MSFFALLTHITQYHYDRPVKLGTQTLRLHPRVGGITPVSNYSLQIEPPNHHLDWQLDANNNRVAFLSFSEPVSTLNIAVGMTLDLSLSAAIHSSDALPALNFEPAPLDLYPYRFTVPTPSLAAYAASGMSLIVPHDQLAAALLWWARQLKADIGYTVRLEAGVQSPEDTLAKRTGSCRDTAWLLVHICRAAGWPARFVSGYWVELVAERLDSQMHDGELHAWCEVLHPQRGWLAIDPTAGGWAGVGYVPLACAADPIPTAPIEGWVGPANASLNYSLRVSRALA